MAWPRHVLALHRIIPSLCLFLFGLACLGFYFGGAAREGRRFHVILNGETQPRELHLVVPMSRGYLFFDPINGHMILVPDKEIKLIDHEPQE
jgi:hypothetical protein